MIVFAFGREQSVKDEVELDQAFADLVAKGLDNFCLAEREEPFPMLAMAINGDLATMNYFPEEGDPGWRSIGTMLDPSGESLFCLQGPGQKEAVSNRFVVSYSRAVEAAKEFLRDRRLPSSVSWLDL